MLRTVLYWTITKQMVVIPYRRFGTTYSPETSVRNYRYSLRNGQEEHTFHLLRGGSLKSRIFPIMFTTLFERHQFCKTECGNPSFGVVGPTAGLGVLGKLKTSCLCQESNHDSTGTQPGT